MSAPSAKNIFIWIVAAVAFMVIAKCSCHAMTPDERVVVKQALAKIDVLQESLDKQTTLTFDAMNAQTIALSQLTALTEDARIAAQAAAALTAERDGLRDVVSAQAATIALQKADKSKLLESFHTFKFYTASTVAGLVALLAGVLIFRFMAPALNTLPGIALALGAPAALGAAAFTLIITR